MARRRISVDKINFVTLGTSAKAGVGVLGHRSPAGSGAAFAPSVPFGVAQFAFL